MVARQSVGSRYSDPLLVTLGLAVGVVTFAGYATAGQPVQSAVVTVAAGAAGLFLVRWWFVARGRRWLSPAEGGFVLEDRTGSRFVAAAEVVSLATRTTVRYGGGVPAATVHRGVLGLRDGSVPFRYEYPLDQTDPLGYAFDHLLKHLTKRAAAGLATGDSLHGDGWELSPAGLRYPGPRGDALLDADDMAAADVADGKVCVWPRGDVHPAVRIPAGSPNARVLFAVLRSFVDATAPDDAELAGGLGRVLFERGKSANVRALCVVTSLFLAGFAGVGWAVREWDGMAVAVGVGAVIVSPLFLVALLTAGNVFRGHAAGVFKRTGWWTRELRFADVGTFTYEATRHYYNGVYTGTAVRLRLVPRPDAGGRTVAYADSVTNGDEALDQLREHVSRVMAERLLRDVEQGEWVRWTRGLTVGRAGLELNTPAGLFWRASSQLLPFDEVSHTHIEEGHFYLYRHGVRKAVYTTPVSVANFFPGLALFEMFRNQPVVRGERGAPAP